MIDSVDTPFLLHGIPFKVGPSQDIDHCCASGMSDEPETDFNFNWTWEYWSPLMEEWYVKHGTSTSGGTTGRYTWDTNASPAPPGQYRLTVLVNDRCQGAASADDLQDTALLNFTLECPKPTNYRMMTAPSSGTAGHATFNDQGEMVAWSSDPKDCLYFRYEWDSTCGTGGTHHDHLKYSTVREDVQYDVGTTTHTPSHSGNCWTGPTVPQPTNTGGAGDDVSFNDVHAAFSRSTLAHSYCYALQEYQGAYSFPNRPSATVAPVPAPWPNWYTLMGGLKIERGLSNWWIDTSGTPFVYHWVQTIEKDGVQGSIYFTVP